jgi:hypothetical protein
MEGHNKVVVIMTEKQASYLQDLLVKEEVLVRDDGGSNRELYMLLGALHSARCLSELIYNHEKCN